MGFATPYKNKFCLLLTDSLKIEKITFSSFRRMPESSGFNAFWMPDQVRHDESVTFY